MHKLGILLNFSFVLIRLDREKLIMVKFQNENMTVWDPYYANSSMHVFMLNPACLNLNQWLFKLLDF